MMSGQETYENMLHLLQIHLKQNVAKNKKFADLQTLQTSIRLYGGLNISRVKFSLITPKTANQQKISPLKYLGYTVPSCILSASKKIIMLLLFKRFRAF